MSDSDGGAHAAVPSMIAYWDANLTCRFASRAYEAWLGAEPGALLGQTMQDALVARLQTTRGHIEAVLRGEPQHLEREIGEVSYLPDVVDGTVRGFTVLVTDITPRKRVEDELRRSNAELEQFAGIAAHDLQEPLRMVASYTELLGDRYQGQLDARADKYIRYAVDGARRMQRLVADLLAYSRLGAEGRPLVPVATGPLVDGVLRSLAALIREAGATVEVGALPVVQGDEVQLGQLVQNLIANAVKFRGEAPARIRIEAHWLDDRWRFSVADNGIGIEMRDADRIFQMFQRLHDRGRYEGSGIGLTIARRIVERHEGEIWLESHPGTGTTFFFTLRPATPPAPP